MRENEEAYNGKDDAEDSELSLSWTIPEPRIQLFFFDYAVTNALPNGDSKERFENYLGRLSTKKRVSLSEMEANQD